MKKVLVSLLALVMVLGLSLTASAEDYGSYDWIAAMTVAETTTNYKMVEKFAQLINEKSNGSINVELYPGGQLGNTTEFTEAVVAGSIDIGTGMVTIALASLLIGGTFMGRGSIPKRAVGVVLGSFIFRLVYAVALRFDMPASMLKLVSSVIVIIAISGPYLKGQLPMLRRRLGHGREGRGSEKEVR